MAIHINFGKLWTVAGNAAFAGSPFNLIEDSITPTKKAFEGASGKEEVLRVARALNGSWGAVVLQGNGGGGAL